MHKWIADVKSRALLCARPEMDKEGNTSKTNYKLHILYLVNKWRKKINKTEKT